MKYEIEIEGLPEGWEPVCYRPPNEGEYYLQNGVVYSSIDMTYPRIIVRKYLIDFGGAFEMLVAFYIIEKDTALFEIPKFYNKFCFNDDYLLLDEVNGVTTIKNKISKAEIDELIDELPIDWEPHKLKDEIAHIIS